LVLADGPAVLPRRGFRRWSMRAAALATRWRGDGTRFFFLPQARRQLAAEIRAQFETFAASGLALDHVNAHKHFHLHPTVLSLILSIGRDHGLRAVRLPLESGAPAFLRPWLR